jgi:hypothetical protein
MTQQIERKEVINELNAKHKKIDTQVDQAHQRLDEKIMMKREIDSIKQANFTQYRQHLTRQHSNKKMFVMLKEKQKEDQIKKNRHNTRQTSENQK